MSVVGKLVPLDWDILDLLWQQGGWVLSQQVHEQLRPRYGYTAAVAKTIQRALRRLFEAGYIDARGRGSARSWCCLPGNMPSKAEIKSVELAVALLQLERFAANLLPPEPLRILREHCNRSRDLLQSHPTYPRYLQGRAWLGKAALIDSAYPLIPPPLDADIMQALTDALYRSEKLILRYQNGALPAEVSSSYQISPLALIERGGVLYLVSCRRSRGSGRYTRYLHRVDRIASAQIINVPADPDPDFDLERFLRQEHTLLFFPEPPQRITLRVREHRFRSRLRHYRFSEDQIIKETTDGFELTAIVRPSLTFKQFILSLSPDVILIKPVTLRKELRQIVEASAASYANGHFQGNLVSSDK
ncbi:helix-turn-helix transcriptional regulator [Achromobacter dolens]|uniref:helix-turn-helix transcriptional regulator n=1 Tax=Achromobacter dolens TaxID=1287738 RepID=UPI0013C33F16|nr:WYL domain-containing protein [Achromobacter dolens]